MRHCLWQEKRQNKMDKVYDTLNMFTCIVEGLRYGDSKERTRLLFAFPNHGLEPSVFDRFVTLSFLQRAVRPYKNMYNDQAVRINMAITKIMSFDTSKPCEIPFFECDLREDMDFDLTDIENMMKYRPAELRKTRGLVLKFPTSVMTDDEESELLEQIRSAGERLTKAVKELAWEREALEKIALFRSLLGRC